MHRFSRDEQEEYPLNELETPAFSDAPSLSLDVSQSTSILHDAEARGM